jgi:hypothetical protein
VDANSAFDEDLHILHMYSLTAPTATPEMCEIHALVKICAQRWLISLGHIGLPKQRFIQLMAQEFPIAQFEKWAECQQLLAPIEPLYDAEPATDETTESWAQILINAAWYMGMKGSYKSNLRHAVRDVTKSFLLLLQERLKTFSQI